MENVERGYYNPNEDMIKTILRVIREDDHAEQPSLAVIQPKKANEEDEQTRDEKTQPRPTPNAEAKPTSWGAKLPPPIPGPPQETEVYTMQDPHFVEFVRRNDVQSFEVIVYLSSMLPLLAETC